MARTENGVHGTQRVNRVCTRCASFEKEKSEEGATEKEIEKREAASLSLSLVLRERKQNDSAAVTRLPRHQLSLEILCTRGYASMQTPLTQFTRYKDFVSDNVSNRGALLISTCPFRRFVNGLLTAIIFLNNLDPLTVEGPVISLHSVVGDSNVTVVLLDFHGNCHVLNHILRKCPNIYSIASNSITVSGFCNKFLFVTCCIKFL